MEKENIIKKVSLLANIFCFILLLSGCATVREDWGKASRLDSAAAYKSFLKEHEQSEYTNEAKERMAKLEDEEWEKAKRLHTLRGYKEFIHIYPNTKYISELKAKVKDVLTGIAIQESNNDPKLLNRSAGNKPLISINADDSKSCEFLKFLGTSSSWGDAKPIEMEEFLMSVGMGSKIGPEVASIVMQGNSIPIKAYNDPTDILKFQYQEVEDEGKKMCAIVYVSGTGLVAIGNHVQAFNIFNEETSYKIQREGKINGKREACFEFNPDTVASAILEQINNSGYGIRIVLTDEGWDKIRQIDASPGNKILFKVDGQVITDETINIFNRFCALPAGQVINEETLLGPAFPKEFIWRRQTGVNDFSKEEAEVIIKGITQEK